MPTAINGNLTIRKENALRNLEALWDTKDPRSLPNLLPASVVERIDRAAQARPDLFMKNENELIQVLRKEKAAPSVIDRRLRLSFWEEYNRMATFVDANDTRVMNIENVVRGVCSRVYFEQHYMVCPEKVSFLVCPVASYIKATEEAIIYGIDQLRDILDLPNFTKRTLKSGKVVETLNVRLMELKSKIVLSLAQQVKGSIISHKIESKSLSITGHLGPNSLPNMREAGKLADEMSMENLDRKLKELEKRARQRPDLLKLTEQKQEEIDEAFNENVTPATPTDIETTSTSLEDLLNEDKGT